MVNSASTNPYVRHLHNKQNAQTTVKTPVDKTFPYKNQTDTSDILDLSSVKKQEDQKTYQSDESAAILDLTKEALEKREIIGSKKDERAEAAEAAEEEGEDVRPSDETRKLTRMLVAAKSPDEVQSVLMDTYNHMREWQKLASTGDKEAIKVVRKLNRLVSRGNRKISDLNKEMVMQQRQQRAEKAERNQEARRLENELKEAQRERKARERRYLQERDDDNEDEESEFGPTMAETEAIIRQLAGQMAALKTNAVDAGNSGSVDVGNGGSFGDGASAGVGGAGSGDVSGDISGGESSSDM